MWLEDFFVFRTMVTPSIVKFLYAFFVFILAFAGGGAVIYGAVNGKWLWVAAGLVGPLLCLLFTRLILELVIVLFLINDSIGEIRGTLANRYADRQYPAS